MSKRKNTFEIRSVKTRNNRTIVIDDQSVTTPTEKTFQLKLLKQLQIEIFEAGRAGRPGFVLADVLDQGQVKDLARALLSWLEYHDEADARSGMKPRRVAKLETQVRNLKNALKNVRRDLKHAAAQFGSLVDQAEIEQAD